MAKEQKTPMACLIRALLEAGVASWEAGQLDDLWRRSEAQTDLRGIQENLDCLLRMGREALRSGLGVERLLAHWAAASGLRHSEDEILAEVRAVSEGEAAQFLEEE